MYNVLGHTLKSLIVPLNLWLRGALILLLCVLSLVVSGSADTNQPLRNSLNLSEEELAWLDNHPVLKLGIDRHFEPYEWLDDKGHYTGIVSDYIRLIEQRLAVSIEPVTDKQAWSDVLEAAKNGEFNLMSCLVETEERKAYLRFSEPYLASAAVIISDQSVGYLGTLDRLNGKTVAIHKGHYTNELLKRDFPEINIVNPASLAEALMMVSEGEAVAFVGDSTAASHMIKKLGILNLGFSGHTSYKSEFRIGIDKQSPVLASIIDKVLLSITKEERNRIYEHWQGREVSSEISRQDLLKYFSIGLAIVLFTLLWLFKVRRSEQAYKLSEHRFKNLVATTDGIVWEADVETFCFTYISDNAERLLGYSVDEWKQPGFWQDHIHPEDREWAVDFCKDETCQERDHEFEYRFITKQGETVWLRDMVSVVVEDGQPRWLRGLILNVTDQKVAEQLIAESEFRFRELIESLPAIAVQGFDEHRRVVYWNDASVQLYGYSSMEAIGQKLEDLIIPPDMVDQVIEEHHKWLEYGKEIPAQEIELMHKSGVMVPVFSSHVMLHSSRTSKEMYCIDISLAEQKKAHKELARMAHFDPLTQLPNRRTFYDRLDLQMKKAQRDEQQVAVMLLDLDHFKEVNDTLGHDQGDLLLKQAASRLQQCVRDTDTVARLGGDEFTIILGELDDFSVVERIAQQILQLMSEPFLLVQDKVYVSASIGITFFPDDANTIDVLLKNADQAMYAAKSMGRNCFHYFTLEMEQAAQKRRALVNDLRIALAEQQFALFFQPIIDLESGRLCKAEALIRWQHPQQGLISPLDFIPIAEETGMIVEIGNWVFSEAVKQAASWRDMGHSIQVSVNTSPIQFRSDECVHDDWFAQLKAVGLDSTSVTVEITETLLMEAGQGVIDKLLSFRDAGIEVSLDDFGTGYSSLAYLKQFDIDYLKIDQSFVRTLQENSNDHALCEAIIVMAHKLGIKVIAEGVETAEQRDLLSKAGCDYGQGYLYSKPVPAAEFNQLLSVNQASK